MAARKPKPRIVSEVCTLCGLDWRLHGDDPTTDVCIRLLAAEVRRLESALASRPISYPVPYPAPYPVPYRPWYPYGGPTWIRPTLPNIIYTNVSASNSLTPAMSHAQPMKMLASG